MQAAQVGRAEAQQGRSAVHKALEAALRTLAAAGLSAALSFAAWQAWRWASGSQDFALPQIRFSGLSHAQKDELLAPSGLHLGENIFRAHLARPPRAMPSHPSVASARLTLPRPRTMLPAPLAHR